MPNIETASNFLDTLNQAHSSVKFTMETECNGMVPFLDIQLLNRSPQIETKVYVKPTKSGLLLHYQSHVDNRYKKGLLRTISKLWISFANSKMSVTVLRFKDRGLRLVSSHFAKA